MTSNIAERNNHSACVMAGWDSHDHVVNTNFFVSNTWICGILQKDPALCPFFTVFISNVTAKITSESVGQLTWSRFDFIAENAIKNVRLWDEEGENDCDWATELPYHMSKPCLFPGGHEEPTKKFSENQRRVSWTSPLTQFLSGKTWNQRSM